MRYRVTTRATVERTYLVVADNPKEAMQASTGAVPQFEHTIEEETLAATLDPVSTEGNDSC